MTKVFRNFPTPITNGKRKVALLISPPIYDTQYWSQWSQPYGLLRIAALLKKYQYKRIELFDFLEVRESEKIHQHRINPFEEFSTKDQPHRPIKPHRIQKGDLDGHIDLFNHHFGKTWREFDDWLDGKGFTKANPPDEIWISAVMTYWWESSRDLIARLRARFGNKSLIILGGIYPTLVPQHAAEFCKPDIVVVGEIAEANNLWTDLSLYEKAPNYAIITPSRGCPYNCAYCAQKTINNGRKTVDWRLVEDVYAEMMDKWERFGIRDFCFYADFLLWRPEENFIPLLEKISQTKSVKFRLYAPEGLDVKYLSRSQKLVDLLKAANMQKIYLPCENIDDQYLKTLNRKHVQLDDFVKAARMCEKAGFKLRNMDVNSFILYGVPGERIDDIVKTTLFVSEIVGSIIPMLFTPVPTTRIYNDYLPYIQERGWDQQLQMLNGKLFPFRDLNEGTIDDYVDLQRLMFSLNAHYRNQSFKVFGDTKVSQALRDNIGNGFSEFVGRYKDISVQDEQISNLPEQDIIEGNKK